MTVMKRSVSTQSSNTVKYEENIWLITGLPQWCLCCTFRAS